MGGNMNEKFNNLKTKFGTLWGKWTKLQKGIIIGHQGVALKKVSSEARKALERFFDKRIYLETFVKVDKDWRSSQRELNQFGYNLE